MSDNPMKPYLGRLAEVKDLATEIKLFRIEMLNGGGDAFCNCKPGQFAFVSMFGLGEAPFGIANSSERGPYLDFAVNRLGTVTTGLHELGEGDIVGVRGPLGNWFPMDEFKGKNLVVLGGGIGGAPLRPVIQHVLDHRGDYGKLTIVWAARHPSLLVFTDEYEDWRKSPDTGLHLTVDSPDPTWDRNVGLITDLLKKVNPSPDNAVSITCGPPIMIHYVTRLLSEMGFAPQNNYVTLEARMHCGLGKCGRCNLGEKLICVDGPVFNMEEVGHLLETYL
ncbi:MAG: FAD/NAD(P)-binding protein [Anaerolineales bacterium]|nr:FAD/NAD(P)-binding protein [Anaerolineales bacterium]